MKLKKKVTSYVDIDVESVGITLLSVEEYMAAKEHIPPLDAWWWLHSPGGSSDLAACVRPGGGVDAFGNYVLDAHVAVRPALQLKSENLSIDDEFIFGGREWVYIGNGLAIAKKLLCEMSFREDWKALDANDYEASDVKKYIEEWLKEATNEAD